MDSTETLDADIVMDYWTSCYSTYTWVYTTAFFVCGRVGIVKQNVGQQLGPFSIGGGIR